MLRGPVSDNLRERHFDTSKLTAWVDEVEGVATFPLWNLSGQMCGYQQYRPAASKKKDNHPRDSRYFTWRKGKVAGVWGLESWTASNVLYVTEGVFDACRLVSLGLSAVATLANDVDDSTLAWFHTVRQFRPVVVVRDNDKAGAKLAKVGHVDVTTGNKDLGDSTWDQVWDVVHEGILRIQGKV